MIELIPILLIFGVVAAFVFKMRILENRLRKSIINVNRNFKCVSEYIEDAQEVSELRVKLFQKLQNNQEKLEKSINDIYENEKFTLEHLAKTMKTLNALIATKVQEESENNE